MLTTLLDLFHRNQFDTLQKHIGRNIAEIVKEIEALQKVEVVARKIEDMQSWTVHIDGAVLISPGFIELLDELRAVLPK